MKYFKSLYGIEECNDDTILYYITYYELYPSPRELTYKLSPKYMDMYIRKEITKEEFDKWVELYKELTVMKNEFYDTIYNKVKENNFLDLTDSSAV